MLVFAACCGAGLLLMWMAVVATEPLRPVDRVHATTWHQRLDEMLRGAGWRRMQARHFLVLSLVCGVLTATVTLIAIAVPALATLAGAACTAAPIFYLRSRTRAAMQARREAWPDAVDHVASAVRAGLSIPEALRQLAHHGPEILRSDFEAFARHDAAHGRFNDSLDVLKQTLADPAADRLIESLRLARNVGGTDVGRLLRTLSAFLREDSATRAELAARQSWTVSAARLALAAPWIALLLVGFRSNGFDAYRSATGVAVLVVGTAVSIVAYSMMKAIGRLPTEERVMR